MLRARLLVPIVLSACHLALPASAGAAVPHPPQPSSNPSTATPALLIPEIEAGRLTTPVIGERTADGEILVTFFARRERDRVPRIVSDVTGWGEHADGTFDFTVGRMTRVGRTEWYSLRATVAARGRIEYLIAYGPGDYRTDPYNPRLASNPSSGGLRRSEFAMPDYLSPEELGSGLALAKGLTTEALVGSRSLGRRCRTIIYTPAGYRADGDYAVTVFLDQRSELVSPVLDWLIAHQVIEPIVVAFVDLGTLGSDALVGGAVRAYLTDELLAWLAARYAVTGAARRRAVLGISFRAKDALDAALSPEQSFGNLGLLIPGRRIGREDLEAIARTRGPQLRVAIVAGRYDQANLPTARTLQHALAAAAHRVAYTEVPEGHNAATWINHLRSVLANLFGPPVDP